MVHPIHEVSKWPTKVPAISQSSIAPPSDNQNCHATNPKQRAPMSIKIDFGQRKNLPQEIETFASFLGEVMGERQEFKEDLIS